MGEIDLDFWKEAPIDGVIRPLDKELKSDNSWRANRKWLNIVGISLENCLNKNGPVEGFQPNWVKEKENSPPLSVKKANNWDQLMGFGKYKDKTVREVKKQDNRYFDWLVENMAKFADRVEKLEKEIDSGK